MPELVRSAASRIQEHRMCPFKRSGGIRPGAVSPFRPNIRRRHARLLPSGCRTIASIVDAQIYTDVTRILRTIRGVNVIGTAKATAS
jgi:hypothetical protein